ncbi:uncharacterized protein PFL1_02834 [Pseudozyma flocculosa PF-1]|uniref:DUF726-domain-containing protein n=2 Tax=Pseudozyma flocculosa TaxID=84751 RepID=A0A5C3F2Q6_9BASI|nr:uncharacterized protein PFL1_02834 [Pseudozyma flocculosa PF-1]EPQ29615.1 hypothetical protein PFL1_02834 [Pseudozyma flocculosa PF-1]SPO38176.1 uncharacterized protein PSFLO_03653 [Pseudozyma flocculosa]
MFSASSSTGGKKAKAKGQQLDLSTLESYSTRWSPHLRLAACIAVKYAVQRCVQRSEVLAAGSSSLASPPSASTTATQADAADGGLSSGAATELVKDWRDYGQKFLTATCQHLGVQEQTLPPEPIRLEDVLTAAQGRTVEGHPKAMPSDFEPEFETGSDHCRRFPKLALPIEGVDDGTGDGSDIAPVSDAEARRKEIDRAFRELDIETSSQRTRTASDASVQFTYDADAKELPDYLRPPELPKPEAAMTDGPQHGQGRGPPQTQEMHGALGESVVAPERIKGVIDTAGGQEIEIAHELLLIALGLGQFRAQDGSTTLFEQDMLFGDTELLPPAAEPKGRAPAESTPSATSANAQQPPPLPPRSGTSQQAAQTASPSSADQNEALTSVRSALTSIKANTITGWGKMSSASKDLIGSARPAGERKGPDRSGAPQAKNPAKPVKPSEICHYSARSRAIIFVAVAAMGINGSQVWQAEKVMAQTIFFIMSEGNRASTSKDGKDLLNDLRSGAAGQGVERSAWMNEHSGSVVEREKGNASWGKYAAMGAGFVGGGLIIGLTGGLAAPLIAPALVGLTGASFLATSGGIVLLGTLFGLGGGGLAGYKVERRLRGVSSFSFAELQTEARAAGVAIPSLHATICCSGLLLDEAEQVKPWEDIFSTARDGREAFAIQCEAEMMKEAGVGLRGYMMDQLLRSGGQKAAEEVLKRTALAGLAALTLPLTVFGAASATLDGVFVRAKTRAHKAGLILAETLRNEVQGHRPVVLVGTSLGAATILSALVELAKDSEANAHLVDSVFLISAPITPSPGTLKKVRSVVQRRFVNVFSTKDMVCGIAAWLGSGISLEELRAGKMPRVIGSRAIEGVAGVENINVSDLVGSHFEVNSPEKLEPVLRRCGLMED